MTTVKKRTMDRVIMNRKRFTRIALAFSVFLFILWSTLGTGTTLAWFTDTTATQKNTFIIGELDLVVSHKTPNGYTVVTEQTKLFDDEALYEPGYVQVVYLKIENEGTVDFDYVMSVDVTKSIPAINAFGDEIHLEKHLKFGAVIGTEQEILDLTVDRETAKQVATRDLGAFISDVHNLEIGADDYAALMIYMPEGVNNVANYRDDAPPMVELGITVKASQEGTLS